MGSDVRRHTRYVIIFITIIGNAIAQREISTIVIGPNIARQGSDVSFTCQYNVENPGDLIIRWKHTSRNGSQVTLCSSYKGVHRVYVDDFQLLVKETNLKVEHTILIKNVTMKHEGVYFCDLGYLDLDFEDEANHSLTIEVPPEKISLRELNKKFIFQEEASSLVWCFISRVKPTESLHIAIYNGTVILPTHFSLQTYDNSDGTERAVLRSNITFSRFDNKKSLTCEVTWMKETFCAEQNVTVEFKPITLDMNGNSIAKKGKTFSLTCTSGSSNPPAEIVWMLNQEVISDDNIFTSHTPGGHHGTIVSSTLVLIAHPERNGSKIVCGSNDMGLHKSTTLYVMEKQDTETILSTMAHFTTSTDASTEASASKAKLNWFMYISIGLSLATLITVVLLVVKLYRSRLTTTKVENQESTSAERVIETAPDSMSGQAQELEIYYVSNGAETVNNQVDPPGPCQVVSREYGCVDYLQPLDGQQHEDTDYAYVYANAEAQEPCRLQF